MNCYGESTGIKFRTPLNPEFSAGPQDPTKFQGSIHPSTASQIRDRSELFHVAEFLERQARSLQGLGVWIFFAGDSVDRT